eukprot:scaffold162299_cov74-Cyclotella_meneghiniana.AAC.2
MAIDMPIPNSHMTSRDYIGSLHTRFGRPLVHGTSTRFYAVATVGNARDTLVSLRREWGYAYWKNQSI